MNFLRLLAARQSSGYDQATARFIAVALHPDESREDRLDHLFGGWFCQGLNLAEHLVSKGWEVYGVACKPQTGIPDVRPVAADLLKLEALRSALAGIDPTHVFFTTWVRRANEEENIAANDALVRNLLAALGQSAGLWHVALVTGLKHYLGPFEYYAKVKPDTPAAVSELLPRPGGQTVRGSPATRLHLERASVAHDHRLLPRHLHEHGVTLAVSTIICRETGRPLVFPGSVQRWDGLTDVTDARVLAKHLEWAATSEAGRNHAFNIANGDIFRRRWLWPKLAADRLCNSRLSE